MLLNTGRAIILTVFLSSFFKDVSEQCVRYSKSYLFDGFEMVDNHKGTRRILPVPGWAPLDGLGQPDWRHVSGVVRLLGQQFCRPLVDKLVADSSVDQQNLKRTCLFQQSKNNIKK